jgi:hypothetical protein
VSQQPECVSTCNGDDNHIASEQTTNKKNVKRNEITLEILRKPVNKFRRRRATKLVLDKVGPVLEDSQL